MCEIHYYKVLESGQNFIVIPECVFIYCSDGDPE